MLDVAVTLNEATLPRTCLGRDQSQANCSKLRPRPRPK